MQQQEIEENRLFLFGAGGSKEAGIPLSTEMTKEVISHLENSHRDKYVEIADYIAENLKSGTNSDFPTKLQEYKHENEDQVEIIEKKTSTALQDIC